MSMEELWTTLKNNNTSWDILALYQPRECARDYTVNVASPILLYFPCVSAIPARAQD